MGRRDLPVRAEALGDINMKTLKTLVIAVSAGLVFASAVSAKPTRKAKTDDLSDLLIQGENRLRVSAPRVDVAWAADIYKDVPSLITDEALVGSLKTPTVDQPPVTFPSRLISEKTASPWLDTI